MTAPLDSRILSTWTVPSFLAVSNLKWVDPKSWKGSSALSTASQSFFYKYSLCFSSTEFSSVLPPTATSLSWECVARGEASKATTCTPQCSKHELPHGASHSHGALLRCLTSCKSIIHLQNRYLVCQFFHIHAVSPRWWQRGFLSWFFKKKNYLLFLER